MAHRGLFGFEFVKAYNSAYIECNHENPEGKVDEKCPPATSSISGDDFPINGYGLNQLPPGRTINQEV
ncbi:hypothetical protein PHLCEN_2v12584 [Hermanssonia centrifuga]|uniref:Uncharacterized protein n=1 Tax=Hermanssonia centrifuga TaxID=98765 RepID=A0A2R6NGS8_9APHY|nr:hypothetical protein PHLCEN_2v12584 [Hermanssonia centrifuga]